MNFECLPEMIIYDILLELEIESIISCKKTSHLFKNITEQEYFWILKSNKDFGITRNIFLDPYSHPKLKILKNYKNGLTPMQIYLQFLSRLKNKSILDSLKVDNFDFSMMNVGYMGDINFINLISQKVTLSRFIKIRILMRAANRGHLKFLIYFNDWVRDAGHGKSLILCAIEGGHIDIVKYIVSLKDKIILNDTGLNMSSEYANVDLVEYFISIGAKLSYETFYRAGISGKIDFVKYMLDILYPKYTSNLTHHSILNNILIGASSRGHFDIIKYSIEKGATNYKLAFINSISSINNLNTTNYIMNLLLQSYQQIRLKDLLHALELVISFPRRKNIVRTLDYIIQTLFPLFGIAIEDIDFNKLLKPEYMIINKKAIKYIINLISNNDNIMILRDTFITLLNHTTKNIDDFKYILISMETKLHVGLTENETLDLLIKSIKNNSEQTSNYLFEIGEISAEAFFNNSGLLRIKFFYK